MSAARAGTAIPSCDAVCRAIISSSFVRTTHAETRLRSDERRGPLRPFALRFPLTLPLRPHSEGQAVMFWTNGHSNTMTFGPPTTGIVVDDTPDGNAASDEG